ncbi:MAG: hypothetical protein K5769_03840 [Pseudobutyrivibrio sp.]|nr:hypothetical protein [Pseudobutyrivibrio sp.]
MDIQENEASDVSSKEAKKEAKRAAKEAKKAEKKARKEAKKNGEIIEEDEESLGIGGKLVMGVVILLILLIWLVIFAFLIKMDVGGFGSTVMYPVLKDVPYVNRILPGIEEYVPQEDDGYGYDNVEDAVARIKELEVEIETLKSAGNQNSDYIAELEAASAELAEYKANEAAFEENKEKFYEEVVFSDKAPDINTYKTYYESIDPENAEAIYKQVVTQVQKDKEIQDYVKAYSSMKPKNAAAIFDTMTDDFDLVCEILSGMDASTRANILAAMDAENAAVITKMMEP